MARGELLLFAEFGSDKKRRFLGKLHSFRAEILTEQEKMSENVLIQAVILDGMSVCKWTKISERPVVLGK